MVVRNSLFTLAEKQLIFEVEHDLRQSYTLNDVIDYAIELRKQLDRYAKKGEMLHCQNIKTKKVIELESKKEIRRQRYLRTGK